MHASRWGEAEQPSARPAGYAPGMDYTSLPIGNAKHIVIRRTDDTVEVLCQPQWAFGGQLSDGSGLKECRACATALAGLLQSATMDPEWVTVYGPRTGTVLTDTNITPNSAAIPSDEAEDILDAASADRAIRRAPWWTRLLRFLHLT